MQITVKVTRVDRREETVQERGKEDRKQAFEDVSIDFIGGSPFLGSAAGGMRLTIDNPAELGKLVEGSTRTLTIT